MEMEMEFYVNTDMHVYVYVCVCAMTLATWKRGRVFDRVFFLRTLKKLPASFRFFFPGTHIFYLKPLLWRDFFLLHYSLLFDRVYRVSLSHPLHIKTR